MNHEVEEIKRLKKRIYDNKQKLFELLNEDIVASTPRFGIKSTSNLRDTDEKGTYIYNKIRIKIMKEVLRDREKLNDLYANNLELLKPDDREKFLKNKRGNK